MHTVVVKLVAVRLYCGACGEAVRIDQDSALPCAVNLAEPMSDWWVTHRAPEIVLVEAMVDGEAAEWVPV